MAIKRGHRGTSRQCLRRHWREAIKRLEHRAAVAAAAAATIEPQAPIDSSAGVSFRSNEIF
ncbi:unnamed protein product [Aureobasidium vineae]|uniref:Uncharacterized protein n=1 Tax=Aureobasidium vineae TaxID=2773715 RepID=A0A9N8P7S2_9PEZI|nr:unnamed protein product [Aureobasidium vineae]